MSKTFKEIGLILGGVALALLSGPIGIVAMAGNLAAFHAMLGLGLTTALAGVGMALRPTPGSPVGAANSINFKDGVAYRRVIYGQFQTAGVLTYASFPPSQNLATTSQYLHLVFTLTGHEISSFDAVVINGTAYNFGSDIQKDSSLPSTPWQVHPTGSITPVDFFWEHLMFEFDFGDPTNASQPFPNLAQVDPTWGGTNCLQRGCAKVHVICRADSGWPALFPSGQIPNIQFLVTGKRLRDPRVVTDWVAQSNYVKFQYVVDGNDHIWVQQNATGTSGSSRPNFEAFSIGTTIADSGCSWKCDFTQASALAGLNGTPQLVGSVLLNDGWQPSTPVSGTQIIESPPGYLQLLTTAGTTNASRPSFSTALAGVTNDNTAVWTCLGRSPKTLNPSNPALVVYDYLLDGDAGLGEDASAVWTDDVIAAANVCEEQVLIIWNADGTKVYENLYSCNGMFDQSSTRGNVLSSLVASMAGWVVPPGDFWHIFAGAYTAPVLALTDSDLRAGIRGDFRLSRREAANSIKGTFTPNYLPAGPAAAITLTSIPGTWQSQSFPAYQANGLSHKPDYITEDGGAIIWQDVHFEFTTSMWTAQRLAKIALMRLRFQQTLTLPFKLTAFAVEAADSFTFTHARWLINAAPFFCDQVAITADENKEGPYYGVDIVARQNDASIYSFTPPQSASDFGEYSPYGVTGVMSGSE